ncbi:hypothetical protein HDV01_000450 [Terramyces sp. JEL0728]|nr:hypothetical protein HDV01_000450 [Terramyces sp. JEL0728]
MITMLPILVLTVSAQILLKCPNPSDIQSDYVKSQFDLSKFADGRMYYEIAYKDITQPRICDCITSNKTIGAGQLRDAFSLRCGGRPQHSDLRFNYTETPGVFTGIWNQKNLAFLSHLRFPDTVVDVGHRVLPDGSVVYDWALEFQCIEFHGVVAFYAFNFYSHTNTMEFYDPMMTAFKQAGLARFLQGLPIQTVKHDNCTYD